MKPQKQAFLHNPEAGVYGDCWRTAIACLLDMDRDSVPHFYAGGDSGEQIDETNTWLNERGMMLVQIPLPPDFQLSHLGELGWIPKDAHILLSGKSPRGTSHVVIANGNGEIAFDPAIPGGGLIGPDDETGCYWVGIIAKRT